MSAMRFDPRKHIERLESPGRHLGQPPELILPYLPPTGEGPVVELGCGTGFFGRAIARYHRHSLYLGLDPSREMLQRFASSLAPPDRTGLALALTEREQLPLRTASVPLLVLVNVLHELLADPGILPEIARVTAPAGSIFVVDWKKRPAWVGPPFFLRVSRSRAVRLFRHLGFVPGAIPPVYRHHYCILFTRSGRGRW